MRIGFIGAGRVGSSLGKYLSENGLSVSGFYSRTQSSAEESAEFIGGSASAYTGLKEIITDSDLIFITVNDGAIADVSHNIASECRKYDIDISNKIFCHTSGALSSTVLSELKILKAETASIHMLLAVNDKFTSYKDFREAFFTVEGSGVPAEVLKKCGSRFQILSAENKSKYHAAAVFASNFVVALAELSCELLEECGFSYDDAFAAIRPLLKII